MEKTKETLRVKLKKLSDSSRKDNTVTFEELGVDRLLVDESHYYKNLYLYTKMRNISGIGQAEAQKSSDLFMKCRYLDEITDSRGTIFATGTPISNTMVELYTNMRYLMYDKLINLDLDYFDNWASVFGQRVTSIELSPEGTGYRAKTRFARFYNLPELMALFREVADIQTADMLALPRPNVQYHNEEIEPTAYQQQMVKGFGKRADEVRNGTVDPHTDNMLKITTDGRKLALDQRLMNPLLPDNSQSKINTLAQNVFDIWRQTADSRAAQLIFSDLSTPKGKKSAIPMEMADGTAEMKTDFCAYDDIREKLIARGIPEEEIAFVHDANTETRKAELFAKVRSGQVRVLLGSTFKMGAGTNVQKRLIALHHLDIPWRPSDIEQREGRIIRRGNDFALVHVYRYVTRGTFDAYSWQLIETKQRFISQVMSSKNPVRSCEDVDDAVLSYTELKSLASGDPRIKEKIELDMQVSKLRLLQADYQKQKYELERIVQKDVPSRIEHCETEVTRCGKDLLRLAGHPEDDSHFEMTIMGKSYMERKEAVKALKEACQSLPPPEVRVHQDWAEKEVVEVKELVPTAPVPVGSYRGFALQLSYSPSDCRFYLDIIGENTYTVSLINTMADFNSIERQFGGIQAQIDSHREDIREQEQRRETAIAELAKPFEQETELAEKSKRLAELNAALDLDKHDSRDAVLMEEEPEGSPPEKKQVKAPQR